MLDVYIGWDKNEHEAYQVAKDSCVSHCSKASVHYLKIDDLENKNLMWRPTYEENGQRYDKLSEAPQSTDFATSRFLVPLLQKKGWALFTDCDVVFMDDVMKLMDYADDKYAVMCVKHQYTPSEEDKMCGLKQTAYPRKNWSSVMLFNCDHIANYRLTLSMINSYPGILLHQFCWLREEEIGELPYDWNWLVGEQEKPETPKIAHFTLGGPWFKEWTPKEHDEIWHKANRRRNV